MDETLKLWRELTRSFAPDVSLAGDDSRFVDIDQDFAGVRGENTQARLIEICRRAEASEAIHLLLAGPRGAGKSSELRHAVARLEAEGFTTLYIDAQDTLEIGVASYADVLVLLYAALFDKLREAVPDFRTSLRSLERVQQDFKEFFHEALGDWEPAKPVLGVFKAAASRFQTDCERIMSHESRLRANLNNLLQDSNLLLASRKNGNGLVIVLDGLDKLPPDRIDPVFGRPDLLCSLQTKLIMTAPISYVYSPDLQHWRNSGGREPLVMPMICLREGIGAQAQPTSSGGMAMRTVVQTRLESIEGSPSEQDIFAEGVLDRAILMSGGHLRGLFRLIVETIPRSAQLPIPMEALDRTIREEEIALNRVVQDDWWELLREFREPRKDRPTDDDHSLLLYLQLIHYYRNGWEGYEVNPILKGLPRMSPSP
ncbi:MAG: ATP-binding protein [Fimbriimonadaceae bacterium]|nr:ATP-binding protein [Fimbriimonadaceae bacterium]